MNANDDWIGFFLAGWFLAIFFCCVATGSTKKETKR